MLKREHCPFRNDPTADDEDRQRRVDIWVRTHNAEELWCDISVPEPGRASYLARGSAKSAGIAAKKTESNKLSKWAAVLRRRHKAGVVRCSFGGRDGWLRWQAIHSVPQDN